MKKIAVAVAAALLAGSAAAANVTLYGVVDTGFAYTTDRDKNTLNGANETTSSKSFSMESGNTAGSRWGLKGTEELGNGVTVGFKLESGFASDTGTSTQGGILFGRESSINVSGSFGTIYAGRMGSLISDLGSVGWYGSMASPFGSGWKATAGHEAVMSMHGRLNNTLVYMSPRFSGLQFSAQYSMGDEGKENKPSTDRYAALGLDYQVGALEVGFLVDYTNKDSSAFTSDKYKSATVSDLIDKNAWTVNLAANYDFGVVKAFAAAQYFKNANPFDDATDDAFTTDTKVAKLDADEDRMLSLKGFGVNLGVDVPVFGGNAKLSIGYADADVRYQKEKAGKLKGYTALAGYTYPISKRTGVYVGAGYTQYKADAKSVSGSFKSSKFQALTGLKHTF
jgi:predicted porin